MYCQAGVFAVLSPLSAVRLESCTESSMYCQAGVPAVLSPQCTVRLESLLY